MQVDAFETKVELSLNRVTADRRTNKRVKHFDWVEEECIGQETLLPNLSSSRQVFYSTEGGGVSTKASLKRTIG
jgi:hypothetical protein